MSSPKLSFSSPNPLPEEQPLLQAEIVQESETEAFCQQDDFPKESILLYLPQQNYLAYSDDEIRTTETIDFNFLPPIASRSNPPETVRRSPQPLGNLPITPWGISGLFCFLFANMLLTVGQFSALQPPDHTLATIPTTISPPSLPSQFSSLRLDTLPSPTLTLSQLSELPSSTLAELPAAPPGNLTPQGAIATPLPPVSSPSAPSPNESLATLLLPPSLQPPVVYATALPPPPSQGSNVSSAPVSPQGFAPVTPTPIVNPNNLPTLAVRPALPSATSPVQLPPPPPISSQLPPKMTTVGYPTAVSPGNSVNNSVNVPETGNNPVSSGVNDTPTNPLPNAAPSVSEQMPPQALNQQNQAESQINPTVIESFNQKTRKKLQTLYNQNQGVLTNPENPETQGLVNQLQQLNQSE